ncbi:MAG: transcriptional repressor [Candidatus Aminicenantes bacterium]|nr:transcriptional repressor [Candidatus Aminicenantes bacterium]
MPGRHHWRRQFQSRVSRWTAPREAILGLLSRASGHLSAKDVYASLYASFPGLGLTTVYRNLELLHRLGIVQKVTSGDGQGRYQLRKAHHHHLICTRCGKIVDYRDFIEEELDLVKRTEDALSKKYNFAIQDHNIEFLGLCDKCR